jgi:hypothetical protein
MLRSEARVPTDLARRYLVQLAKHFQHKLPVEIEEARARIEFPMGVCTLEAEAEPPALLMRAEAAEEEALTRLEGVVVRHLERFAFRDPPAVAWRRS